MVHFVEPVPTKKFLERVEGECVIIDKQLPLPPITETSNGARNNKAIQRMKYYLELLDSVITYIYYLHTSAFAIFITLRISTCPEVRHLLDVWWLHLSWMIINLVRHILLFPTTAWQAQEETARYHQATTIRQKLELLVEVFSPNEFSPISYVITFITICLQIAALETDDVKLSHGEAVYSANYIGFFYYTFCILTYALRLDTAIKIFTNQPTIDQNPDTTVEKKPATQVLSLKKMK